MYDSVTYKLYKCTLETK